MPRKYSMERRNASIEETRDRIVEATMELHNEKGILATSMQDIAARAGVSLGTVYRHFPSLDELVPACGARTFEVTPPPSSKVFADLEGGERVRAFFVALYVHYEQARRPYEVGLAEATQIPVLQALMERAIAHQRGICAEATAPLAPSEEALGLTIAMASFHTWRAFNEAGFSSEAAAALASEIVLSRIAREKEGSA